jgi:isoleucyl-tRNA synthetase
MVEARRKFNEIVDDLKKQKMVKSSLELIIETDSNKVLNLDKTEAEDWFITSGVYEKESFNSKEYGDFVVDGDNFIIKASTGHKCPRCWKYKAKKEEELCDRCKRVLDGFN